MTSTIFDDIKEYTYQVRKYQTLLQSDFQSLILYEVEDFESVGKWFNSHVLREILDQIEEREYWDDWGVEIYSPIKEGSLRVPAIHLGEKDEL